MEAGLLLPEVVSSLLPVNHSLRDSEDQGYFLFHRLVSLFKISRNYGFPTNLSAYV